MNDPTDPLKKGAEDGQEVLLEVSMQTRPVNWACARDEVEAATATEVTSDRRSMTRLEKRFIFFTQRYAIELKTVPEDVSSLAC